MLARSRNGIITSCLALLNRAISTATKYHKPLHRLVRSHPLASLASILTLIALLLLLSHPLYILLHTVSTWTTVSPTFPPSIDRSLYQTVLDVQYGPSEYEQPVSAFSYPLTITTAYYPFPSKHSSTEYHQWLANFLTHNPTPLVIYTTAAFYPQMASIRYRQLFINCTPAHFLLDTANALHRVDCPLHVNRSLSHFPTHFNLSYTSPLELPITALYSAHWDAQLAIDPERAKHSPTLYATWNAKAYLVNETATANPFHSKYFAWMDAGQFRNRHKPWQLAVNAHKLAETFGEELPRQLPSSVREGGGHLHPSAGAVVSRRHKLLVNVVHPFPASYCTPFDPFVTFPPTLLSDHTAGQSFIGTATAIRWYADVYYRLLLSYQARDVVWGKDQNVANGITFAYHGSMLLLAVWKVANRSECVVGRGWDAHWSWMGEWLQHAPQPHMGACPDDMYAVEGMVVEGQAVCDGMHKEWLRQSEEDASRLHGPPVQIAKAEAEQMQLKEGG